MEYILIIAGLAITHFIAFTAGGKLFCKYIEKSHIIIPKEALIPVSLEEFNEKVNKHNKESE